MSYNWKMKGLAKGINPEDAVAELTRIQNLYGSITPDLVVKAAEDEGSVLHKFFEWDDTRAGQLWRIQQARSLLNNIQVSVISDGEAREVDVYEVISRKEGYQSIDTFTYDNIEYIKAGIIQQLNTLKNKLKLYKQFNKVLEHINQAIDAI
jgi:hypothetical protein